MLKWNSGKNIEWFLGIVFCYWVLSYGGFSKYIFVLCAAFWFLGIKQFNVCRKYLIVLVVPMCYFITGVFFTLENLYMTKQTFKVFCFIFIPAVAAICIFNMIPLKRVGDILDMQFWAIAVISITSGYAGLGQGRLFENQYAYILGAYVIYYYALKRGRMFLAGALFTFLANKRIVLVAVVISVLLYTVIAIVKSKKLQRWMANCVIVGTTILCYIWIALVRNRFIFDVLGAWHINSNGRTNIWSKFEPFYEFEVTCLGKGMGFVVEYLRELHIPGFDNLHNDLLLLYIETGFLGFGLCVLSYFALIWQSRKNSSRWVLLVCLIAYSLMNYLTDNILIYINYWLPGYLLILGIMFAPLKHGIGDEGECKNVDCKI